MFFNVATNNKNAFLLYSTKNFEKSLTIIFGNQIKIIYYTIYIYIDIDFCEIIFFCNLSKKKKNFHATAHRIISCLCVN